MRDIDTIDSELRLLVAIRHMVRQGGGPAAARIDQLLDERRELTGRHRPQHRDTTLDSLK
jgi:hypothetical protein